MAIIKKKNQQTESRLLLESSDPVELPPAEIEEKAVSVQFDTFKAFVPELLDALRLGAWAEPVPVMLDDSTFAIETATRTFWVKLWHASAERTRIDRAQVIGCMPRVSGVRVVIGDSSDYTNDEGSEEDFEDD